MNKRYITSYTKSYPKYHKQYSKVNNQYLITDSFSMLLLNKVPDDYNLIEKDVLTGIYNNFNRYNHEFDTELIFNEKTINIEHVKNRCFDVDKFNKMKRILKDCKLLLLKKDDNYVLKMYNKDNECGYLLNMRVY